MRKLLLLCLILTACGDISEFPQENLNEAKPSVGQKSDHGSSNCDPPVTQEEERIEELPYFYQYDNYLHPSSSCQNTSIAMVLASLGWEGEPDDITREWGKDLAQSPQGLAHVFNTIARREGIRARIEPVLNGTLEELQRLLREGKPTIIHGYFTSYGHVIVARSYNGIAYKANDPAGRWNESFGGGYLGRGGENISYAKASFEAAVATSDGWNYLPLWYHKLIIED